MVAFNELELSVFEDYLCLLSEKGKVGFRQVEGGRARDD